MSRIWRRTPRTPSGRGGPANPTSARRPGAPFPRSPFVLALLTCRPIELAAQLLRGDVHECPQLGRLVTVGRKDNVEIVRLDRVVLQDALQFAAADVFAHREIRQEADADALAQERDQELPVVRLDPA